MTITTMSELVAALGGAQRMAVTKAGVTGVAGGYTSMFAAAGQPGAGSLAIGNTTTGVIPTDATAGAFPFNNPFAPALTYLAAARFASSSLGTLVLYDRLWHGGSYTSVNGTISSSTTTAIDRYATGAGVELWAEINAALSATATTIQVTYVDQGGTGGNTASATLLASSIASRMYPFTLAAGDSGIRQITAITGSAAPTGTFNLVMLRRIAEIPIVVAGVAASLDFADLGLPQVADNACIAMFMNTNSTSTGAVSGSFALAQG